MELKERYCYRDVIYTSGPGSYMSIKITYITLATMEIVDGIKFSACDAFALNGNKPIKAMGKIYFIKEKENIITEKFNEAVEQRFQLPDSLEGIEILESSEPIYVLPAV